MLPKLFLPNPDGSNTQVEIEHNGSAVIIGANGAGKSRLGAWIEKNMADDVVVHRLSAQRALDIPDFATVKSLEQSLNALIWGHEDPRYANKQHKWGHRWGSRPETFMQNDFDKVLSTLFARSAERDRLHVEETKAKKEYVPVQDSPIEDLIKLWDEILPHRKITLIDGKVTVKDVAHNTEYHGKEMSDGERVALYLMGQCLSAPDNSIIIIDEPEIHLHTSIMQSLWNKLEEAKQNCVFLYITHDLNFVSTRVSSKNIWVKEFDGKEHWNWEEVPDIEEFPESLLLELLGNRRTVIFVEGEKGGKDHSIYQSIYRTYNIVPRNGCQRVIDSVKAMCVNAQFHHVNAYGIIDRDYRSEEEIKALNKNGVYCIDVAEIENILLNEHILRMVATNQHLDPDDVVSQAIDYARTSLKEDIERQISLRTYRVVEHQITRLNTKDFGLKNIKQSIDNTVNSINVDLVYEENKKLYERLAGSDELDELLKYYNNKGLISNICAIFELGRNGYEKLVLRMLNSEIREELLQGLRKYVPEI